MKSGQWDGGKGDASRISDYKAYHENASKIEFSFDKKKKEKEENAVKEYKPVRYLFLDDIRVPDRTIIPQTGKSLTETSGISPWQWDIVRSYDEFVNYIETYGIPQVVAFDNDLDFSEIKKLEVMLARGEYDYKQFNVKTGCHCAEYLADKCIRLNHPIPTYYIHTMNALAKPIIKSILESAKSKIAHQD